MVSGDLDRYKEGSDWRRSSSASTRGRSTRRATDTPAPPRSGSARTASASGSRGRDGRKRVVYVLRSDRDGGDTKTKKSRRGIAVADMAVDALTALRKRQAAEKLAAGDLWQGHNLVFCRENGAPYTSDDVLRRFQSLTRTAGLGSNWVPRELRHTFVSIMSDQGVALEKISDLVGHSGTHTTQTVYRHELRPVITTGAEKMNAIFNEEKSRSA
ncbi:tyrosine-type recombinase/integrase [Actinomadura sp. NPDC048394]|uniref:site-specific integrase n=1 Tax=Actinomadura sp. NPDC048394 TaxID=3158223 RepID=UPI0034038D2D